jgi:hypothetical protein
MGFILRTVFWLVLAMVVIPPQARLGGDDTADFRNVDLGQAVQSLTSTAWTMGGQALRTCETNPGLCKAGQDLWRTTVETAGNLADEAQNQWQKAGEKPRRVAENHPRAYKKIQARVE